MRVAGTRDFTSMISSAKSLYYISNSSVFTVSPFIVITNESQYADGLSILFHDKLYSNPKIPVPWPLYATTLIQFYMRATRQETRHGKPL